MLEATHYKLAPYCRNNGQSVDPTIDQPEPDDQRDKPQPEEEEEPDTLPVAITL